MNTLLRYIEANGRKMRKLKAYLRPSLTTCCRNLFERTEEKRRRIRASDNFQFSSQFKLTAILRRNIQLAYPRTMSSKNPEKSLQRSESHLFWHWHGKGKKIASCSCDRRRRRGCSFLNFEFSDPNPVALQRTVWWFLYNTSVSEQENITQAIRFCLPPLQFLQVQT